jgi:glyoxylase-like metal-dependent hydrolase (beta-lactamase superfamily II)
MARNHSRSIRHFFLGALIGAAAVGTATVPLAVHAQPPAKQTSQAPGYYRMAVGDIELTALYDGHVSLRPHILKGASQEDIQGLLARMFVPASPDGVQTAVNGFLVNTGQNLILVDAGAAKCFGPTLGAIVDNIRAAGYQPSQVDSVLLTHLHADHACGISGADGKAVFPNATVYVAEQEAAFWLSPDVAAKAPADARAFFDMAQASVAAYSAAGKLKRFKAGDAVLPGVVSVPLHGHTPGHGGYLFSSGRQKLLVWGDVVHSHAVQFPNPEVSIEFDVDPPRAIASRKKVLEDASDEKLWVAGAHLPFPGLGHVRREGAGYAWIPVEYSPLPATLKQGE